ncbi:transcriptional regulator, TetR family [Pseudomonas flavescens]|uniref:Transcriptional regulator, TetR family n=1 Tax=Phytopseudomonas flavescens TaxID=29435 RepID=A0A1G8JVM8_9GAMM|nr:TetR/AcrR family transcriptional regulator [Pseudomonas flavescens]SDI35289.1 transcriptional regulator, TetR family [Pseudomonas flavescens]
MPQQQVEAPPGNRTSKGALRLRDLTAVAAELFLERGFASVAVDDLIARVGGSRRNVYSHFGGKEGLFIEAVEQLCAELARPLEALNLGEGSVQEALSAFGHQLLQAVLQPRTLELHRLMLAEGKRFPALSQAVLQAGHFRAADILAPWIEAHQATPSNGFSTRLPAQTLAQQFVNIVVMEAQLRALAGLDQLPLSADRMNTIVNSAVTTFLHGAQAIRSSHDPD